MFDDDVGETLIHQRGDQAGDISGAGIVVPAHHRAADVRADDRLDLMGHFPFP